MVNKKWWFWRQEKKWKAEILDEAGKSILKNANYKRGNSTRQLSQQLTSKGDVGGKRTVREGKRNLCSQPCSVQLDWNLLSQYKNLPANGMIFFFPTNVLNICFSCPIRNMILFGVLRSSQVPPAYRVKKSCKWIIWGGITGRGFTGIHFLPQAKTLTTEYYINNLLEKEVKPLLYRENHCYDDEATDLTKMFSSNHHMTFVQDGDPTHAAKATPGGVP